MNNTLNNLLEAHLAFTLNRLQGDALSQFIDEEISALHTWLTNTCLNDLTNEERVFAALKRNIIDAPLSPELITYSSNLAAHLAAQPINKDTRIGDLVDDKKVRQAIQHGAELDELRATLIHNTLHNPMYRMLVSETLYNGIRDYFTTSAKKVPGMGSLLNKSADLLSKRMPDMEERVRQYISNNLSSITAKTEAFLTTNLTRSRVQELGNDIWALIKPIKLDIDGQVHADDIATALNFSLQFWEDLRKTDYFTSQLRTSVAYGFATYGDQPIATLLNDLGVTETRLRGEANAILPALLTTDSAKAYLAERLRAQLQAFYQSDAAAQAL